MFTCLVYSIHSRCCSRALANQNKSWVDKVLQESLTCACHAAVHNKMLQHCCCCSPHSTSSKAKFNKHKVLNIPLTNSDSVNIIFHRYSKHHKAEYHVLTLHPAAWYYRRQYKNGVFWQCLMQQYALVWEKEYGHTIFPGPASFYVYANCVCYKIFLVNMDLYKHLVPKNSRNNHIIECTKAEKASLASKDWIGT